MECAKPNVVRKVLGYIIKQIEYTQVILIVFHQARFYYRYKQSFSKNFMLRDTPIFFKNAYNQSLYIELKENINKIPLNNFTLSGGGSKMGTLDE